MDERIDLSMSDPDLVPLLIQVLSQLVQKYVRLASLKFSKENLKPCSLIIVYLFIYIYF